MVHARAFSSCGKWGPLFIAVRGPLFIAVRGPLTIAAPPVAGHRLQTRRLSSCGSRAQPLRGMWDLPRPGLEPVSPALAGRFSTSAPPGKPPSAFLLPPFWTQGLVEWRGPFHSLFFQRISLVLLIVTNSSTSSLYLYFSDSTILGKTYLLWSWRPAFMWKQPYVDCVSPIFLVWGLFLLWMLARSFPQGVLILIPFIGVLMALWWLEPALNFEWGLLFALWLSQPCQGQGLLPSCWSRRPQIQFYAVVRGKRDWSAPSGKWAAACSSPGAFHQDVWPCYATCYLVCMPTKITFAGAALGDCLICGGANNRLGHPLSLTKPLVWNLPKVCLSACSGSAVNQLIFQPCLRMCGPTNFAAAGAWTPLCCWSTANQLWWPSRACAVLVPKSAGMRTYQSHSPMSAFGVKVIGSDFSPAVPCACPQSSQNLRQLELHPAVSMLIMRLLWQTLDPPFLCWQWDFYSGPKLSAACTPSCGTGHTPGPRGCLCATKWVLSQHLSTETWVSALSHCAHQ